MKMVIARRHDEPIERRLYSQQNTHIHTHRGGQIPRTCTKKHCSIVNVFEQFVLLQLSGMGIVEWFLFVDVVTGTTNGL